MTDINKQIDAWEQRMRAKRLKRIDELVSFLNVPPRGTTREQILNAQRELSELQEQEETA